MDIALNTKIKAYEQKANIINITIRRESCCSVLYANTCAIHTCYTPLLYVFPLFMYGIHTWFRY